ncbi:hypothetical protein, conserved [Eimeria necatrix]|uniref:Uncharacterized protein n=1 Tax=Eimeria necatrix TaxID=51315 RepID=U6MJN1_9EIME|nr:hypothetical protein, conserved [Eimeria necatrix]CDJ62654.1 hypothetical protein, conserved [Eimeria necatrix]
MEKSTYPSPFPAYTETYLTPDGYVQGNSNVSNMAYYAGGPDPTQTCAPSASEHIFHSDDIEVHQFDPMPAYDYVPTTSPPLYQPAVGSLGFPYQDPNMQTFCHAFGSDFAFYNTAGGSGMPQGYHIAMQGFPEAAEARKAIKKEIPTPPSMVENAQSKKTQKRKSIACC